MSISNDKMVLRTVYLPFDLDQDLKSIAFSSDRSKGDLIRELIKAGIESAKKGDDKRFRFVTRDARLKASETVRAAKAMTPKAKARSKPVRARAAAAGT